MCVSFAARQSRARTTACVARVAALTAALAFAGPAIAASIAASIPTSPPQGSVQNSQSYKLEPGDSVIVTVFAQPQFSGRVTVDGEGNVVLPFVGPVRVEDLTVSQCQKLIEHRLAAGYLKQPLVSVSIYELRPVYVLGNVRRPGAYPFQYGGTVESAVALAGGFGLPGITQSAAVAEYLTAEEQVRQLASEQLLLRIRAARLDAQRDGQPSFTAPARPTSLSKQQYAKLVASEQSMFKSQNDVLAGQLHLLNAQKPRLKQQIQAVYEQMTAAGKRLEYIKREEVRSVRLLKQGLGVRAPEVQLRLDESNAEMNVWNLAAQRQQLEMDLGNLDIEIQRADAVYKTQVMDELQKVRERLDQIKVSLPAARSIVSVRAEQADGAAPRQAHTIELTRQQDGRTIIIRATPRTPVEPGDIVDVKPAVQQTGPLAMQGTTG